MIHEQPEITVRLRCLGPRWELFDIHDLFTVTRLERIAGECPEDCVDVTLTWVGQPDQYVPPAKFAKTPAQLAKQLHDMLALRERQKIDG